MEGFGGINEEEASAVEGEIQNERLKRERGMATEDRRGRVRKRQSQLSGEVKYLGFILDPKLTWN